jgi:hypothetical protein
VSVGFRREAVTRFQPGCGNARETREMTRKVGQLFYGSRCPSDFAAKRIPYGLVFAHKVKRIFPFSSGCGFEYRYTRSITFVSRDKRAINVEIIASHSARAKALFKGFAAFPSTDRRNPFHG